MKNKTISFIIQITDCTNSIYSHNSAEKPSLWIWELQHTSPSSKTTYCQVKIRQWFQQIFATCQSKTLTSTNIEGSETF